MFISHIKSIMNKTFFTIILTLAFAVVSCKDYQTQIDDLQSKVDALSGTTITVGKINAGVAGLQKLVAAAQNAAQVKSVTPGDNCYVLDIKDAGVVELFSQTSGITVGESGGSYYWKLAGEWLTDASGAKVPVATDLKFKVEDYALQMSVDGGKTWKTMAATDAPAVTAVSEDANSVTVALDGGTSINLPKYFPLSVAFSGDGSTFAATGKVAVDYYINGEAGAYNVAISASDGWEYHIDNETEFKGTITFTAPEDPASQSVEVFVGDNKGHLISTVLNLPELTVKEDFPVLAPATEAYCIGSEGGQAEVTLDTNLEYEVTLGSGAAGWLTANGTKAVRTDVLVFTAVANDSHNMRSAAVTIASGIYSKVVTIYQEGLPVASGQNLSAGGTANCYIVTAEGDYYFDATVMGNGQEGIIPNVGFHSESAALSPVDVDFVMEGYPEPVIENLRLEDGKVYFHANGKKGNATVCVYDASDRVVWSWHIWCTDRPADRLHMNPGGVPITLLDRNLGATSTNPADGEATFGLYYQWGRKDPFTKDDMLSYMASNASIDLAGVVARPYSAFKTTINYRYDWIRTRNNYLWGNPEFRKTLPASSLTKTIYDPCPAGYMVPPSYVFYVFEEKSRITYLDNGFMLKCEYGQTSFYPYSGRLYQGFYDAVGYVDRSQAVMALWHSCAARYHLDDDDGGTTSMVYASNGDLNHKPDFRSRGIPVRCIKQE